MIGAVVSVASGIFPRQARTAQHKLKQAETIVESIVSLCELTWALRYHYAYPPGDIAATIRQLLTIRNLEIDLVGANAGLAMLEAGGDFADGVIAYDGLRLGGETFVPSTGRQVRYSKTWDNPPICSSNQLSPASDHS